MNDIIKRIIDPFNLRCAWEKVLKNSKPGDMWVDQTELAAFELNLKYELNDISKRIQELNYCMSPITPIPYPKAADDEGNLRIRQTFKISTKDQVAWTAIINVIGSMIDIDMPTWSYGNRLFRSIWVEEDNEDKVLKIGNYRNASGKYYLNFRQSWAKFKRHVYLTTRAMTSLTYETELSKRDQEEYDLQKTLNTTQKCPYIFTDYWSDKRPKEDRDIPLYWCSVDLEKFYPSLNISKIVDTIIYSIRGNNIDVNPLKILLNSITKFILNVANLTEDVLTEMDLRAEATEFPGIPTGLFVAGFLANVAMLNIDKEVNSKLNKMNIAHFRYVDDHIFLAYDFNELVKWVNSYKLIIETTNNGAKFNIDKVEPKEFSKLISSKAHKQSDIKSVKKLCTLDPKFPSPLMTKTLGLVSEIGRNNFDLLSNSELDSLTDQLEHLLLVDLPEEEIPEKTRVSFAASRLATIAQKKMSHPEELYLMRYELEKLKFQAREIENINLAKGEESSTDQIKLDYCNSSIEEIREQLKKKEAEQKRSVKMIFDLLRKVLRDRPERLRLWNKAISLCRIAGIDGIQRLADDIAYISKNGCECKICDSISDFLFANFFSMLSYEIVVATKIAFEKVEPQWKIKSADNFLQIIKCFRNNDYDITNKPWFVKRSNSLYLFSKQFSNEVFCSEESSLISRNNKITTSRNFGKPKFMMWLYKVIYPNATIKIMDQYREMLLNYDAKYNLAHIWKFFPNKIPSLEVLKKVSKLLTKDGKNDYDSGLLYDAWRNIKTDKELRLQFPSIKKNLSYFNNKNIISLYDVVERYGNIEIKKDYSWFCNTEWTKIEIIKQIINCKPALNLNNEYILNHGHSEPFYIHPANFAIPKSWLNESVHTSWEKWKNFIADKSNRITYVSSNSRIRDWRYIHNTSGILSRNIDEVRGLGLLLYGLINNDFSFPSEWNNYGDYGYQPRAYGYIMNNISCSSWTLGVLQACLTSRSLENLSLTRYSSNIVDDDMGTEIIIMSLDQLNNALTICQKQLSNNQMSTYDYNARQLIPISIKQLTEPDWKTDLGGKIE